MSYANVQTLIDRVNTTTGNIVYTAASSLGTEVVFNNLVSAGDITMTQPGGYHFPKLANAGTIDMKDDYETLVTRVNFPALTTATAVKTDATGSMEVVFTYATSVDFGALVTAPSNTITITTKKDATLDLGAWVSKDASGNYVNATVALNGPASFTNGTAAGTFASTGLPGNTLGAHDGSITLDNVATAAIHNFRGSIDINGGVKTFTGNNVVSADIAGATALETINMTMIRDNVPGQSATTIANLDDSDDNTAQDLAFTSTHAKLASATITGKTGDITFTSVPLLATVDLTGADAFVVSASGNASLTSWTDASKAEDRTFSDNDLMTSVSLSATTKMTATGDTGVAVTVNGNAELATLTLGMNSVDDLSISLNPKLATLSGATALTGNGTSTTTDVDIHQNAFVASLIKDTKEEIALASTAVGGTTDLGSITTTSGLKDLDAYITDAIAASGTVSVWFDTVTKLETQATFGGTYTDVTSSLTAPTAWDDTTAAGNADNFSGGYEGYYAYAFQRDGSAAVTSTTGARASEYRTYVFDVGRNTGGGTYDDKALATNEGIVIAYVGGTKTFKQGDTYNGSTVTTVDQLVAYMNADTVLDAAGVDVISDRTGFEKTLVTLNFTQSAQSGNATVAGTISDGSAKQITYSVTDDNGTYIEFTDATADNQTTATLVDGIKAGLSALAEFDAVDSSVDQTLIVTRSVSGGTVTDRSPIGIAINVVPQIDAKMVSTTANLLGNDQMNYTAHVSNTAAIASGYLGFTVTERQLNGFRVTLKNSGSGAFTAAVSVYAATVSNTAILTAGTTSHASGHLQDLDATNAPTFANDANIGTYMTAFTEITAGTTTTTTAAVTDVTTNRTGW